MFCEGKSRKRLLEGGCVFCREDMEAVSTQLIDAVQLGSISDALNVTVQSAAISEPLPDTDGEAWEAFVS